MNLSEHFELSEFLRSETAARKGVDMRPTPAVLYNLKRLATLVLEPIRAISGPLVITSGYRPKALNDLIGGSKTSDHLTGSAADIHAPGLTLDGLLDVIKPLAAIIPLKQCIEEYRQWVHVSIRSEDSDGGYEFLTARYEGGQTVYART